MANQIKFDINFDVDKSGLSEIQQSLQAIQNMTAGDLMKLDKNMNLTQAVYQLDEVKKTAQQVGTMLQNSFNQDLGTLNISKFNEQLKSLDLNKVYNQFASVGTTGQTAFRQITTQILTTNTQLKESHALLDSMATTMANTVKWGVASSAMNKLTGSVQEAYGYVKSLDTSLNNIRIVTEKSSDEMAVFAKNANDAAKALGTSTTDYTNASLIYYQQGLSDEEAAARTEVTLKTANVTGQAAEEVSEQLTAVWNGYQITSEQAEASIDTLAAVAANTASNLEELSTGMSKVASAANAMGVGEEQLAAQLSTIISATRQAPESVGTALRTVYARMSTIATGGIDEDDGATLTSYTKKMENFGISVLDVNGQLRDMGDVVEEVGGKWDTFTREQQISLAQTMAGTRQYNYILALFENWDEYTRALNIAEDSVGTLQQQQDTYMESTAAHLEQMNASFEDLYDSLLGTDAINAIVDVISGAASAMATFIDSIGGGSGALLALGSVGVSVFSTQIANGIATTITNLQKAKDNTAQLRAEMEILQQYQNAGINDEQIQKLVETKQAFVDLDDYMSESDRQQSNALIQQQEYLMEQKDLWDAQVDQAQVYVDTLEKAPEGDLKSMNSEQLQKTTDAIKDERVELQKALDSTKKQYEAIDDYQQKTNALTDATNELTRSEQAEKSQKDQVTQATAAQETSYNELRDQIKEITNEVNASSEKFKQQSQAYNEYQAALGEYNKVVEKGAKGTEFAQAAEGVVKAYENMNKAAINAGQQAEGVLDDMAKGAKSTGNKIRQETDETDGKIAAFLKKINLTKQITEFENFISAIGKTASAMNTLNNIFDVWRNQDLSTTEKLTQTFTGLAMAIPMVVSGIQDLAVVISGALGVSTGGVAVVLGGLFAAITAITQIASSYTTELERATETAEALAQANDDIAQSLTDVKNNIDAYDDAVGTLEDCVQGTEEWQSALEDVNDAAVDVINSLSGLSGDDIRALYSRDTNGNIQLDREALNGYVDRQQSLANSTELASGYGEYQASMAQISSDYKDLSGTVSRLALDLSTSEEEASDALLKLQTDVDFQELSDQTTFTADDLKSLRSKLFDMAEAADAAQAKLQLISDLEVSEAIGDSYGEDSAVIQQMVSNGVSAAIETEASGIANGIRSLARWADSNTQTYQDVLKALNNAGYNYTAAGNAVQGSGSGNRTLSFYDENGELVTQSAEYWANIVAAAEQMSNLETSADEAAAALQNLSDEAGEDIAGGIADYIVSGNLESLTKSQRNELANDIGPYYGETGDMNSAVASYLKDMGMSDYIDASDFLAAIEDINTGFANVASNLRQTASDAFEDLADTHAFDDLSLRAQKSVADMLENTLDYGGEAAMTAVANILGSLGDGLDDFIGVADQFSDSWGDVSYDSFLLALQQSGYESEILADDLYTFIAAMNSTGEATRKSEDAIRESYKAVQDITSGLGYRDTITQEDYDTLIQEGITGLNQYFRLMNDGTYMLTTSAEKFADEIQRQQFDKIYNEEQKNNQTISSLQNAQGTVGEQSFSDLTQSAATETGIDTALVTEQISLLRDLEGAQADVIGQWEDQIETGAATAETYQEIADAVANCEDDYNNIDQTIEELHAANLQWEIGLMETAGSLSELQQMLESGLLGDLEESEEAMAAYNTVAAELSEASRIEGLDSDEIQDYSKYLQNLAKESDELANSLENDDDAAYDLAVQIMRMNNGVETLADNWDDWSDVLKKSSKESQEYYDALENTRAAMADLLDTDSAFISDDTIIDHMDDIALAAQGDADAIDRLREAAYEGILVKMRIDDTELYEGMEYSLSDIQAFLDDNLLEVGASIQDIGSDADAFIDSLNALIDATQMTSDEVQAMLSDMGYNVTFEEGEDNATTMVPTTHTTHTVNILDWAQVTGPSGEVYEIPQWETVESAITSYEPATEEMESIAAQIETGGGSTGGGIVTTSPHVANITKKASGAANNYSSANSGGKSLGSSGGGSKGSGGGNKGSGSGSSSEPAEPAHEDYIESQADRYHDVDLRLKEISNTLSRLQKQEDKLYGQALLDNLNDQLSTLDSQLDATNDKLAIAQEESAEYRKTLSSQGVKFDENGYITNYDKVMEKQLAYVNSVIDKYNSMSAEEQEAYQDTLDKAKEDYDAFVELINNYESVTFDLIPELSDSITDSLNQEIEIQIKKFTMEVEIRLDMTDAEQSWNEFYRKVVLGVSDDDALGQAMQNFADILSYYNTGATDIVDGSVTTLEGWWDQIVSAIGGGTGSIQAGTNQVNSLLEEYNKMKETGWSDVYGDNEAQLLSDLQDAYTELMTELEAIEDLQDSIMDSYLDKIDEAIDAFDEQVSQYEFINDLLNHDMNLIGLLYGDDAYEEMSRYYKQIEENNNQELDFLRKRVDYAYKMMNEETDPEARKKWQEEWENALSELNDKVEDAVQNIIDEYSNAIAQIIDELNKQVTNGLGLDYVSEEWDLMKRVSDTALDAINAEYSIQSLENKYNQAINSTDSITAQKKLNDVMAEQIDYLREKENLTQYDVDRANMVYEITLKQLALEEAQQNKSTLRLRRDAQGNYTYQYVADEDEIQTLQQELADLENQLYNLDKQAYVNNLDQILAIYEEFQEKILELYQDQTLSAEEREAKIAMYVDEYGKLANRYVEANGSIRENLTESTVANLASLYGVDVTNFKNMTDEELDNLMEELVPGWNDSVQGMADTFAGEGGMVEVCSDALDKLDDATDAYDQSLDDLQNAAGICFDEIAGGYDEDAEAAKTLTEDNDDLIDSYDDEITEIKAVVSALGDLADAYDDVRTSAIGAVSAGYSTTQEAAAAAAEAANQQQIAQDTGGKSGSDTGGKSGSDSDTSGSTQGNGKIELGDKVLLDSGKYYENSAGGGKSGSKYVGTGTYLYVTKISSSASYPYHLSTKNQAPTNPANQYQLGWVEKKQISGYATGGYTGDWNGDEGELAVLHQKELVLNRDDTKNLLSAIGIVRDVATMLDGLNTSVLNKVSNLITNLSQVTLKHDKENKVLEQDVHIEAHFPNVTNSNEIENAFNNLVNIASMHAYSTH